MHDLLAAVQFLTRVPVRVDVVDDAQLARAVAWFPAVGGLVGLVVGGVAALLVGPLGALPACVLGVASGVLVTGALHEDGLGDVADGFWGGWEPERRMTIMRDSRLGTYGVLAVVLGVLLRVALLAAIVEADGPATLLASAVLAHVLSRAGALVLMVTQPRARPDGLGAAYLAELATARTWLGAVVTSLAAVAALSPFVQPPAGLAAIGAVAAAGVLVARTAARKVGGITGDVLGAAQQVGELACLTAIVGLVRATGLAVG